jgi:hypothetical protein
MDLYKEHDYPQVMAWAQQLSQLDSVKESVSSPFDSIYQQFIQRRGSDGYLINKLS